MTDLQVIVAIASVSAFIGFAIGWIIGTAEVETPADPTEHGGWPL